MYEYKQFQEIENKIGLGCYATWDTAKTVRLLEEEESSGLSQNSCVLQTNWCVCKYCQRFRHCSYKTPCAISSD